MRLSPLKHVQQSVLEEYAGALLARRTAESVISAVIQPLSGATAAVQLVQPLPGLPASAVQQGIVPAKVRPAWDITQPSQAATTWPAHRKHCLVSTACQAAEK